MRWTTLPALCAAPSRCILRYFGWSEGSLLMLRLFYGIALILFVAYIAYKRNCDTQNTTGFAEISSRQPSYEKRRNHASFHRSRSFIVHCFRRNGASFADGTLALRSRVICPPGSAASSVFIMRFFTKLCMIDDYSYIKIINDPWREIRLYDVTL
jgi:hypothetical protein